MINDNYSNKSPAKRPFEEVFSMNYDCFKEITEYPDSDARMEAFTESLHDAIRTDEEAWDKKGYDMMHALATGNIEYFLAVACGWGAKSLAKRAMIIRDPEYRYHEKAEPAMLRVRWDDGFQQGTSCLVDVANFRVYGCYARDILKHPYNKEAKILETVVAVTPIAGGNEYEYRCVSKEELEKLRSECLYWYDSDINTGV